MNARTTDGSWRAVYMYAADQCGELSAGEADGDRLARPAMSWLGAWVVANRAALRCQRGSQRTGTVDGAGGRRGILKQKRNYYSHY